MLEHFRLHFAQAVTLFALYSFLGWIIEVIYRSVPRRRFVNAGFLYGPFTPIYGSGAAIVIAISLMAGSLSIPLQILIFAAVTTVIEYIIGYSVEKIFGFKLWDYSANAYNYKGIICPTYTLLWTILAIIFLYFIHPFFYSLIERIKSSDLIYGSIVIILYFAIDLTYSVVTLSDMKKKLSLFFQQYIDLPNIEINTMLSQFRRLFSAFPDLNIFLERNLRNELREKITEMLAVMNGRINKMKLNAADDSEFLEILGEISSNSEYQRLKDFYHHSSTIYEHIINVAYTSFRISKYFKLDYRSATRGALLHDFFCYDWRNHDVPDLAADKFHGIEHPKIALANSEKYYTLNNIEKDIIIKHMWPLTINPPKFKESYVVTFADKLVSSREYSTKFKMLAFSKISQIKNITKKRKA
jgi:uncharacterized membrane protein/HD superfamily phosphohydrolase YqeK